MIICCFSSFVPCHVSKHTFGIDLFCIFSSFSFLLPSFFFIFLDNLSWVELDKLFPPSPSCLRLWPWLIAYYMEIRYYIFYSILQFEWKEDIKIFSERKIRYFKICLWLIPYYMEILHCKHILQYSAILMNKRYWDISNMSLDDIIWKFFITYSTRQNILCHEYQNLEQFGCFPLVRTQLLLTLIEKLTKFNNLL